jgi:hypothetical protein
MIKSLIILALLLLLVAGAFLSRPSPESLRPYLQQKMSAPGGGGGVGGIVQGLFNDAQLDAYMKSLTFKNRLLWMDVEREGQTVYTGAFAHWWQRGEAKASAAPTARSSPG